MNQVLMKGGVPARPETFTSLLCSCLLAVSVAFTDALLSCDLSARAGKMAL